MEEEEGLGKSGPRNCGVRRHKALAPWRFQRGFVRRRAKDPFLEGPEGGGAPPEIGSDCTAKSFDLDGLESSDGMIKDCKLEPDGNAETSDCSSGVSTSNATAEDCNLEGLASNGGARECDLDGSDSNGIAKDCKSEGLESTGAARDCCLDGFESNATNKGCNLEGLGSNQGARDCGMEDLESNGAAGESNLEGSESVSATIDSILEQLAGFGSKGAAKDCNLEGLNSNSGAKDCSLDGLRSTGPKGCNLEGRQCNSKIKDCKLEQLNSNDGVRDCDLDGLASNCAFKDVKLEGSESSRHTPICPKRQKALAPWRFQLGYKRSFSKAFCSSDGSVDSPETPKSMSQDSMNQHTAATGNTVERFPRSCTSAKSVSATCNFSCEKNEKETTTASKKRRIEEDAYHESKSKREAIVTRESVMESLRSFYKIYRKLMEKEDSKWRETGHGPRPDLVAFKIFREGLNGAIDDTRYVGNVPGIQVGDVFHLRVELCIAGLHRQHRMGIDFIRQDGKCTAVSIVSYGHSSDAKNNFNVLVYTGSMMATSDQKMEGGNLALKRSMDTNTPVRVIHGFIKYIGEKVRQAKAKKLATYIYGGQYLVEKYWREKCGEDQYVCMFRLKRIPGQPYIDIPEILNTSRPEKNFGIYIEDISQGQEKIPISVVNGITDEYPMPFRYITKLKYPSQHHLAPPTGCDCVDGCSDSEKCACAVKNGGEIPFNDRGKIVEAKPLVYECGPWCKCPPTCHNRVSQHGIKFQLQVFKTEEMGWGVRSLNFIPSGSFVCEYIGEVLEDDEAQSRTSDEYLFAIGNNYYDESLWEGLSRSIPSLQKEPSGDEEVGFAVDASLCGNFARFINHSCTPNMYAQNLLYDHDNKSMPHIMFFASEDIPALQELTYHYNYTIDQVHDSDGNIKKKKCLCGSIECSGWLY